MISILAAALVGLMPAIVFLVVLMLFDSYKMVSLRLVLITILVGGVCALASYLVNAQLLDLTGLSVAKFSRYVAPISEESIKALIIIYLIKTNRIGFLVDAVIFGCAVGAGFAIVENLYYLQVLPDANFGVWIVRGFGTAVMHAGVAVIFAVSAQGLADLDDELNVVDVLPSLLLAILTHSLYNHFFLSPILSTMLVLAVLPVMGVIVIETNEKSVEQWLNTGFDADAELLELLNSGELPNSHVGHYLQSLKLHFKGEMLVDMLCYLRLHVELALRAKGLLMMRESGFDVPVDADVREKLEELKCLEDRIGVTGRMAMRPLLHMSRKDLWQLYMLSK